MNLRFLSIITIAIVIIVILRLFLSMQDMLAITVIATFLVFVIALLRYNAKRFSKNERATLGRWLENFGIALIAANIILANGYVSIFLFSVGLVITIIGASFQVKEEVMHETRGVDKQKLKSPTFLKKNWKFIIGSAVTIILTILANQVVQPLVFSRISQIDTEPLYIQSLNYDYYAVFRVSYTIEPPLFPWMWSDGNKLSLQLPTTVYEPNFGSDLKLISNFKEASPYVNVDIFNFTNGTDISLTKSIPITLTTDGFQTKVVKSNFYMMQKLDSDRFSRGRIEWSDRYWWNDLPLSPALLECWIASSNNEFVGYGKRGDRYYSFERQMFENKCPLEVRGFRPEVYKSYTTVCNKENELTQDNNNHLSFDLKPDEETTILFIEEIREPYINNYTAIFNYTYQHESVCLYAWRTYQKL
ncbi:MAG: hypothetical protein V1802_00785 [Candidatus Aenigmatarchaeota archaeon]